MNCNHCLKFYLSISFLFFLLLFGGGDSLIIQKLRTPILMYIILYSFVGCTLLQPYKAVSLQICCCCVSILLLCAPFNISSVHAKFKGSGNSLTQYMQKYSDMLQIVDGWNDNPHISTTTLLIILLVFWCILIIIFYPVLWYAQHVVSHSCLRRSKEGLKTYRRESFSVKSWNNA